MNTRPTLWTCSGGMKIVYLREFIKMIPHTRTNAKHVDIAYQQNPNPAFWDPIGIAEMPIDASFQRSSHKLNLFHSVPEIDKMRDNTFRNDILSKNVQEKALALIEKEFKIMVAKREPTFFIKDLSMENVDKLSVEYAKNMSSNACGLEMQLSPYQKFFVIIDPSDLIFYFSQIENYLELRTEFLGKLIDLRPDKWVMGRYENLTYLKELNIRFNP